MATIEKWIKVDVPVRQAYNQWTQFEEFPRFMKGVESIEQLDATSLHWKTNVGGVDSEFDAEITEQHPDQRVAWRSTDGTTHAGVVTFHRLSDTQTKIMVQIEWAPEGLVEKAGALVGEGDRRVQGDLERFRDFIESRGTETGGWRGDVDRPSGTGSTS